MQSISNTYRIIALIMAFVMFATTVNLAIDMHYCQGQLKSVSFFGKAATCHEMAAAMKNCPHHQKKLAEASPKEGCSKDTKDCCSNKTMHLQSDLDRYHSSADFQFNQELQHFVIALVNVFFNNNFIGQLAPNFQSYKPPIVVKDYSVLFQSFLI